MHDKRVTDMTRSKGKVREVVVDEMVDNAEDEIESSDPKCRYFLRDIM